MYDLNCFQNIVIYVAGNDASNMKTDTDVDLVEEKYEQLLYLIRQKNEDIKIYLCSVCPRGDTTVEGINEMIKRQCNFHEGIFIDTYSNFFNKHNQLKSHFYQPRNNIHLSPSGTRGLLGAIHKYVDIVQDFKKCAVNNTATQKHDWTKQKPYSSDKLTRVNGFDSNHHNGERCFKCGLTNHKTNQCFHKKQVQCFLCKFFGHKDSICWNQ